MESPIIRGATDLPLGARLVRLYANAMSRTYVWAHWAMLARNCSRMDTVTARGRIVGFGKAVVTPARRGTCLRHLAPGPRRESSRPTCRMKVTAILQVVLWAMWPDSTAALQSGAPFT